MSWCDKLASVPSLGFDLTPHYSPIDILLDALSPVLDRAGERSASDGITIEAPSKNFEASFVTYDGFKYYVDHSRISVGFNHRVRFKNVSGGLPTMEMLSRPQPYTKLLEAVTERAIEAALLLPQANKRSVRRVGVVSTTPLAKEDIPPGLKRFLEYLGRPWKGKLESYSVQIQATWPAAGSVDTRLS